MSPSRARLASAGLTGASSILILGGLASGVSGIAPGGVRSEGVVITLAFVALGGLLSARRPGNPIGWLFAAAGAGASLLYLSSSVPVEGTGTAVLSWLGMWGLMAAAGLPTCAALLLFPNGRLTSRRWRPVMWLGMGGVATMALTQSLMPFEQAGVEAAVENPLALPAISGILELVFLGGAVGFIAATVAAVGSLFVRYRQAAPEGRLQVRWVALAAAGTVVLAFAQPLLVELPGVSHALVTEVALLLLPASVAVAVLRYRLYDLDRLVSRTLSYGLLTGVLLGVYAAAAVVLGRALSPLTRESELAVAAATLLVAALFTPLRRRVQALVDRRFNRARYDAQQTIGAFAGRLRDGVDLDELHRELVETVGRSVEPASTSLWLREAR